VSERNLLTATAEFYVRTGASLLLPRPGGWTVSLDGLVEQPAKLHIDALRRTAKPMGLHLMECAGNVRLTRFGLISVANWEGVPLVDVLSHVKMKPGASRVCISGFDRYANPSLTSKSGASWIFPIEELKASRAFLATGMNGQPHTPDHGAPVRLFVPGWYGCACIKWVNQITLIDEEAEATTQMQEYAARTLQDSVHQLARDYRPALIDHTAMPVRVEKWMIAGKLKYRVVGLLWGGSQLVKTLQIRFNPDQGFVPITGLRQSHNDPWTVWTHTWSPREPGSYTIRLAITDPPVQARKLDAGLYDRVVEIGDV
jgi:DMSO/TMAO reductase YedYZ molybdopterin-dependent catalytic subunit